MSRRPTMAEQLHDYAVTRDVAADARSTRDEFRRLDARIAELEAALRKMVETAYGPDDVRQAAIRRAQAALANQQ